MQLIKSFPPADALLSIEYKKIFMKLVYIVMFVAAVVHVCTQRIVQWYNNGGKETIITARNFIASFYSQTFENVMQTFENVLETYNDWRQLVTVA